MIVNEVTIRHEGMIWHERTSVVRGGSDVRGQLDVRGRLDVKGLSHVEGTIGHEVTFGYEGTIRHEGMMMTCRDDQIWGMIRVKGTILWKSSCAKHSLESRARQCPEFLVIVIFHTMDCSY